MADREAIQKGFLSFGKGLTNQAEWRRNAQRSATCR